MTLLQAIARFWFWSQVLNGSEETGWNGTMEQREKPPRNESFTKREFYVERYGAYVIYVYL
jgi:hypothetical protein